LKFCVSETPRSVAGGPSAVGAIMLGKSEVGIFANADVEPASLFAPDDVHEVVFPADPRYGREGKSASGGTRWRQEGRLRFQQADCYENLPIAFFLYELVRGTICI
jgi:hypothetical protein